MRSPLSYLTSWFAPLLVRFNVYLGATKGLFDASVVLLLVTACTSSAIAMIMGHLTDLGFYQGQRWAVFAGPVMLLGVSLFSVVSSVSSMVVMARMSQNVLVTLGNSFFFSGSAVSDVFYRSDECLVCQQRHHCTIRCHRIFHGAGA